MKNGVFSRCEVCVHGGTRLGDADFKRSKGVFPISVRDSRNIVNLPGEGRIGEVVRTRFTGRRGGGSRGWCT